jgi:hypothetical protein
VQLVDPLANSGDPDAERYPVLPARENMKDSDSVVLNFDHDGTGMAFDTDGRRSGARVAMNVGQRFLHDAKDGEF